MSQRNRFYLEWIISNPIGFTLGSLLGATSSGFVPMLIPGLFGLMLGDLIFGAMFGFAQYLVFRRTGFLPVSIWWIIANSVGFTLGARIGALLTFRFTDEWSLAGIIFGVIMGTSVGLATAFALFQKLTPGHFFVWLGTSILAWIAGESIAFAANFSLITVPLVALAIASLTGLGLIHLQPRLQAE
jgi:hypothetical protein